MWTFPSGKLSAPVERSLTRGKTALDVAGVVGVIENSNKIFTSVRYTRTLGKFYATEAHRACNHAEEKTVILKTVKIVQKPYIFL